MLTPGRILISFAAALVIIYACAVAIGAERKSKWFKKRRRYTLFTRRGLLGEALHFGAPRTAEGFLTVLVMFLLIAGSSYIIVYKM